MLNWRIVGMEILAMAAAYLIIFLPVAAATNYNIYLGGAKLETVNVDHTTKVDISVQALNDGQGRITVNVSNASSKTVLNTYIFRCGELSPSECLSSVAPESYPGGTSQEYDWADVAGSVSSYPQTGYIIIIAELQGPTTEWAGFHYRIFKYDQYGFDGSSVTSTDISSVDIYAKTSDMVSNIRDFVSQNGMVPSNEDWLDHAVLNGATGYHEAATDTAPSFTTTVETGNTITTMTSGLGLEFPTSGQSFFNPISFSYNPSYTCGQDGCESVLGETSANCCYDCGCPSGQYCDADLGCRNDGMIALETLSGQQTGITNCYVPHNLNIYVKITGAPATMSIINQSYRLGSQPVQMITCAQEGSTYRCPVTVPADPDCSGTDYTLGPNSISFSISFPDGMSTSKKTLTTGFPDVTVGSWTCGNSICETGVGENEILCCYDCACQSGQYCDFSGDYGELGCKNIPSAGDLMISDVDPTHFYTHSAGDSTNFIATIANMPEGLSGAAPECGITCIMEGSQPCDATCSVNCAETASDSPGDYQALCSLGISLGNYNSTAEYSLYPTLSYALSFYNGSLPKSVTIQKTFPTLTVGAHWCGDGICNPDEDYASCCSDCSCPGDQYCDSESTEYSSINDQCKPLNPIALLNRGFSSTSFVDSSVSHEIQTVLQAASLPSGASISPSCSFASGSEQCAAACSGINESMESYCRLTLPAMPYSTSPHYDSSTRSITLTNNTMSALLSFNNGSETAQQEFSFPVPDATVDVVYHCGNEGRCETDLGEGPENCCIDCGCPAEDQYCYTAASPDGMCLDNSGIYLSFIEPVPSPINCTIMEVGGDCVFLRAVRLRSQVPRPPDDMAILSSRYKIGNETRDTNCISDANMTNHSCSVLLDKINSSTEGEQGVNGTLEFTITYTANGTTQTKNISTPFSIDVSRVKNSYVKTCEEELANLDSKIKSMETNRMIILAVMGAIMAAVAGLWVGCGFGCEWCCDAAWWGTCIALCVSGVLLPLWGQVKNQLEQLKAKRETTCNTNSYSGVSGSNIGGAQLWTLLAGGVLAIACTICLLNNFGSSSSGQASQTSGSSATFSKTTYGPYPGEVHTATYGPYPGSSYTVSGTPKVSLPNP